MLPWDVKQNFTVGPPSCLHVSLAAYEPLRRDPFAPQKQLFELGVVTHLGIQLLDSS